MAPRLMLRRPWWANRLTRFARAAAFASAGFRWSRAADRRFERWGNRCAALIRRHTRFELVSRG